MAFSKLEIPIHGLKNPNPKKRSWGLITLAVFAVISGASTVGVLLYLRQVVYSSNKPLPVVLFGTPLMVESAKDLPGEVHSRVHKFLSQPVRIKIGQEQLKAPHTYYDLGFFINEADVVNRIKNLGHSGSLIDDLYLHYGKPTSIFPVIYVSDKAFNFLQSIKEKMDRLAVDARLDIQRKQVVEEKQGILLKVYESLVAVEYAARSLSMGQSIPELALVSTITAAQVTKASLGVPSISHVMGHYETSYSGAGEQRDREFNLKIGADRLHGHVIQPHEIFSFDKTVGPRTEKQGYRIAAQYQAGEVVDGVAGGMCQLASTLHAAAFFAGLDIVSSQPHSRPSAYIPMALDATIAEGSIDLKLRNPYDFPVVISYEVRNGEVKVEILGEARPYKKIIFERVITGIIPPPVLPQEILKADMPGEPQQQRLIVQASHKGYIMLRKRHKCVEDDKCVVEPGDTKQVSYDALREIDQVGIGPATLKPKKPESTHPVPTLPAYYESHPFILSQ